MIFPSAKARVSLRVVVVEDSEDDALLILRKIKKAGYDVASERVETGEQLKDLLARRQCDLIISDFSMPSFDGIAALNILRQSGQDLPFILISGVITEEKAVTAMKAGAHDFISKNNLSRLVPAIERELREADVRREHTRMQTELEAYHAGLEKKVEARTAALRFANKRLRRSKALSDALNRIGEVIHSTLDFDQIMKRVVIEAARAIGANASSIGLLEDAGFTIKYAYNLPRELVGRTFPLDEVKGVFYVIRSRDTVVFNDAMHDERVNASFWREYKVRSLMASPLILRNKIAGAFTFYIIDSPGEFTEEFREFAQTLSTHVSLALENARLFTEHEKMEDEIRHMAHHDSLTGLPNRRLFKELIALETAQMRRHGQKMALFFLDLDRFKELNDTLGHEAGDELLRQAAARLKRAIRVSDTVARIGGDEFNLIIADIEYPEYAAEAAQKILNEIGKPFMIQGNEVNISASIGISVFPDDGEEVETLLRYADIAMYHVKEKGRNDYQFYNTLINTRSLERMRFENSLRQAIERGELRLYFQPLIDVKTGRIVSAEALLRWKHPERGILEPHEFLTAAEHIGFMPLIDEWVIKAAGRQIKTWMDEGNSPVCVTINLSPREFQSTQLVKRIAGMVKEMGISPESLSIEITEMAAMADIDNTVSRLDELREMGIHVSIDDFGSGYSSLNHLKRLPVQKLKIDRSFIQDISTSSRDRAIITAVLLMAHSMKLKVVAEGVEAENQLTFLRALHCDEAQGYLFSKPVPAEKLRELVGAGRS